MKESHLVLNQNPAVFSITDVPVIDYVQFWQDVVSIMKDPQNHILAYFPVPVDHSELQYLCAIANDVKHNIRILSHEGPAKNAVLESITPEVNSMHIFEREIHENFGVEFPGHPWLKPVRWPYNRFDASCNMDSYPFFHIKSDELHEVGVGPVHAGVIEPGHFRFVCNGEKVFHLEIHLGYQHRGVESLMVNKKHLLQKAVLSECIAGDTAIGHSLCHAQLIESLAGFTASGTLQMERVIALELERIAVHLGDTAALCGDIAYQLGQVVCESLRTVIINTTQRWCGNRFGKGLIRAGGTHYPLTADIIREMLNNLTVVEKRFNELAAHLYSMPGALSRFDGIGTVTREQGIRAGLTGMAARMCGIPRDIRVSHPFQGFTKESIEPALFESGDVLARALVRRAEIKSSAELIRKCAQSLQNRTDSTSAPDYSPALKANTACISLTEGWRGEIVHVAVTGHQGDIAHYKIADPSLHNWTGLALAVRDQEISDFPVCNKSFNLSYCGYDL